ncbi:MAG TPA: tetratricopeptide repeat protein [Bacteroidales bacterium]
MAKEKDGAENKLEGIEGALSRTEHYIEENRKSLTIIAGAIIAAVLLYFAFNRFYLDPKEKNAQRQMYVAEQYFEKDSFKLALNGDGNYPGFLTIIDEFGLTDAANIAHYYAGVCYKNLGNYSQAIEYLKKFDSKDKIISCEALGAIADCYADLGQNDEAIKYYKRAANNVKNDFTTPLYLLRAGILLEDMHQYKEALETYQRIEKEYNASNEGREIQKYITRAKIKGNL